VARDGNPPVLWALAQKLLKKDNDYQCGKANAYRALRTKSNTLASSW
jgi:hypothetical protein